MEFAFNSQTLNIAYSSVGLAPINTAEHYQLAAHLGFNALKGDVRITKDGHIVMCHDAGITLDENGRIGKFDRADNLKFLDLEYDYVKSLRYAACAEDLGYFAEVCDFDTYIRICKETGKIAYITLRDNRPDDVAREVIAVLRKYRMESHSIVNSFTYETLCAVRRLSKVIPLSWVQGRNKPLSHEMVDKMLGLAPSIVTLFLCPGTEVFEECFAASEKMFDYASANDVQIFMAIIYKYSEYAYSQMRGIQGMQIGRPFMPYTRTDVQFMLKVKDGCAEFSDIIGSDRIGAEVSYEDGIVRVSKLTNNGSGYGFDDALPLFWLRRLPHNITVSCGDNPGCSVSFDGRAICVDTCGIDGTYYVNVNI